MDEFAQSREDNDLFADEFDLTPAVSSVSKDAPPAKSPARSPIQYRRRDDPTTPGGARGGRGGGSGLRGGRPDGTANQHRRGLSASRFVDKDAREESPAKQMPAEEALPKDVEAAGENGHAPAAVETPRRPATAVRGDRSATGGPAVKKLSPAELAERMEKMRILNEHKAERFRRSEADSAAFAQKERELQKRRAEEQRNHRAMDLERAKNRERKLKAQGGREWDLAKQESDLVDGRGRGRSSQYVRGDFGGVKKDTGAAGAPPTGSSEYRQHEYMYKDPSRPAAHTATSTKHPAATSPASLAPDQFPSLPSKKSEAANATGSDETSPAPPADSLAVNTQLADLQGETSWAEEVASAEAKNMKAWS